MLTLTRRRFLALSGVVLPLALAPAGEPAAAEVAPATARQPRVRPLTRPGRQPRRRNFEMSDPVVVARPGEPVSFEGHKDSPTLYLFLDREGGAFAPFGVERIEVAAGTQAALPVLNGVPGRSYSYLVYLVAFDDLADGNSPPKILIATLE